MAGDDADSAQPRAELMRPYRHPVRHCAVEVWRAKRELRRAAALAGVVSAAGLIGVAAGEPLLMLLAAVGLFAAVMTLVAWWLAILREAWRLRRSWSQKSELATVRARRPQAGGEDPDLAHDEFAVTAEDSGYFITWRFRPLPIAEHPTVDEIEVPGRPRYAAGAIEQRRFDAVDAARAAEQLVEAQERAERREAAAATAARRAVTEARLRADLAVEAESTAAALQRTTGQRGRRD